MWRIAFFFSMITFGCSTISPDCITESENYPGSHWEAGTVEQSEKFNQQIAQLVSRLNEQEVHRLLVTQNGYILTDVKHSAYNDYEIHDIASLTKSVMSILVGIAIDRGLINSEDDYIDEYLHHLPVFYQKPYTKQVKIKHLLSMTSGLDNYEDAECAFAEPSLLHMLLSDDYVKFLSELSLKSAPGNSFSYNSLNYHLLSIILFQASGLTAHEFAKKYLFDEIGIKQSFWQSDKHGYNFGWGNLHLSETDLARIGHLINSRGRWDSRQIVSMEWILKMLTPASCASWNPFYILDYGYGWFLPKGIQSHYFLGMGRGGQILCILPKENSVIVTSGNFKPSSLLLDIPALSLYPAQDKANSSEEGSLSAHVFLRGQQPVVQQNSDYKKPLSAFAGRWEFEDKQLGLRQFSIIENSKNDDNVLFRIELEGRLMSFSADFYQSVNRGQHVVQIGGKGGSSLACSYLSSWGNDVSIDCLKDCDIILKVDEVESINTFYIGLSSSGQADKVQITLYEHELLPNGYSIEARQQ